MKRLTPIPLPPSSKGITLNPLLEANEEGPPCIIWDVRANPLYAQAPYFRPKGINDVWRQGTATTPPVRDLVIRSYLDGTPIVVFATGANGVVTILDVLSTVHQKYTLNNSGHAGTIGIGSESLLLSSTTSGGARANLTNPWAGLPQLKWGGLEASADEEGVWALGLREQDY